MGLQIPLPGVHFTDTARPILRDDPILPDLGALLLVDPTHPLGAWSAGVPATVPNLVSAQAAVTAVAAESTLNTVTVTNTFASGAQGILERSGKGGLHGISSQVSSVSANYARLVLPVGVSDYVYANPNNDYYVSSWGRITRNGHPTNATATYYFLHGLAYTTAAWNIGVQARSSGNMSSQSSVDRLGLAATKETDGRYIVTSAVGTKPSGITAKPTVLSRFGPSSGTEVNGTPSHILYRVYIEDLTKSGRTWADVNALDVAEYTKQVKTAGGRYYGDTFTDPTTIP
jgi:hypothetical protein